LQVSILPASFRDPSGFLFQDQGVIFRQVNQSGKKDYDLFMDSGLYDALIDMGLLIPHEEVGEPVARSEDCYKTLQPKQLSYISYPYEWCFSQLKDAAMLTLRIQWESLKHGMTLKDATAYNVQFHEGKPIFIDTLSFESYEEGAPWVAYRQFCQHFLAPLVLINRCDYRTIHLLRYYIDGIPLDLASRLLPAKSWFSYSILAHIHLHAKTQKKYADSARSSGAGKKVSMSKLQLQGLISSLQSAIEKLTWEHGDTEWGDYYEDTNYIDKSMQHKELLVKEMLSEADRSSEPIASDYGANTGKFSRLAIEAGYLVLSHDIDEVAVDKNYRKVIEQSEKSMLPLMLDLTNPSPGLGWAGRERMSFVERQKSDVGMALALIHHIAISNNVPLDSVALFFSQICRQLIIEFVPKSDSQVERLLATREDIFPDYNLNGFEAAFSKHFSIQRKDEVKGSERTLYLMKSNLC
jgi:hypothetical protein